jgi:hypothetical protein
VSRFELAVIVACFVGVVVIVARDAISRRRSPRLRHPHVGRPRIERDEDGIQYVRFH